MPADAPVKTIRIAAALLIGPDGRTLLVRKRGTTAFMQAGGKIEPGEAPMAALARELEEELSLRIDPSATTFLGRFSAPAVHEPDSIVEADIYRVEAGDDVRPAGEIEETVWVDPAAAGHLTLAPLTRDLLARFSSPAGAAAGLALRPG